MSVEYEQLLDELTVHVWLLYDHPSIKYRISGNFGAMEILALLADDKNTPN